MKLCEEKGLYIPSFFVMYINDNTNETFLHELIHFLQDISTTFGLINISRNVDAIKDLNRIMREEKTTRSNFTKFISKAHRENQDLFSYYLGHGAQNTKSLNSTMRILNISQEPALLDTNAYQTNEIMLEIGNDSIRNEFHFGALDIMESMAHILESFVFNNDRGKYRRYPYDAVSMIIEHKYPCLQDKLAMAELCEASLMFYHPAEALLMALDIMKEQKFCHSKQNDTYTFVLENIKFEGDDISKENIDALMLYKEELHRTAQKLDDLITSEPYKSEQLGRRYVERASQLRISRHKTITGFFYQDGIQAGIALTEYLNTIGVPLILTNDGDAKTHPETESLFSPFLFHAIYSIYAILLNKATSCYLKDFCAIHESRMKYDERCLISPWTRVYDQELCPFAHIWRMWDFEQYNYKMKQ
jgi:hypothetical protein